MDISALEAAIFFANIEGNEIKTIDELDNQNEILYVTLSDGRQGFVAFRFGCELYIEEEI